MPFDFLLSADMMVPDPDGMTEILVNKLGIYKHANWRQAFEHHPYIAHFLRVHKSLAMAPTRVEPQVHLDKPNPGDPFFHDFLDGLWDFQGRHRPIVTHSVVVAAETSKNEKLYQRLHDKKLPFRLARRTPDMPFDRCWVGVTPEAIRYEPSVDGGLCIEVMPSEPLRMPPETFMSPPPEPKDFKPGEMVRVTGRGFLVRDLDDVLRKCSDNLDWEPRGKVEKIKSEGYKRARMAFTLPHSASLDVIEPTTWNGDAGLYMHNWGPGLYYIRIAVVDLAAKAEDLRAKGVRFTWIPESEAVGGRALIKVDPEEIEGQLFEFEEYVSPVK